MATRGHVARLALAAALCVVMMVPGSAGAAPEADRSERAPGTPQVTTVAAPGAFSARGTDNPWRRKVVRFRKNWVMRSTQLNRCAFIEATATLIGHWRWAYRNPDNSWNHRTKNWQGFKLRNPAIHVTGWPILGAGCNSTERWRIKARIGQGWYSHGCSLDVDVSFGFPWSVEANPSYECGTNRLGHTRSVEGPSRKTLHQWNTGVPIVFDGVLADTSTGVAFAGGINLRVFTSNASAPFKRELLVYIK